MHLDLSYLQKIAPNDNLFIIEMLELFVETVVPDIREMPEAFEQKDFVRIRQIAHKSKSAVHMLGVKRPTELITQIEQLATSGSNSILLFNQIREMQQFADEFTREIKNILELIK